MRNVKFNFLLIFFLIFGLSYQGYADCPWNAESNTEFSSAFGWKGWRKEIKVIAIKDQGIDGYFNPKIKVCSKGGESYPEYCHELYSGTSCRIIYGNGTTQASGAAVSAMTFIDWEGNKTSIGAKMGEGLKWEWADGLTDKEKEKFANSPKICACMQKGACMSGASAWGAKAFSGYNIFRPGEMQNVCDTCYQTKVKCAPVPLAPGPPPFCTQLGMSPPQVRIVPITNKEDDDERNDYFDPKVKVIIGNMKDENGKVGKKIDFPKEYGKDKAKKLSISDNWNTKHYFETYKEKSKLCAEYYGTQEIDKKNWQFSRCFPAPHAPEPEIVEIVKDPLGNPSNTLKIKIKMSQESCTRQARGDYSGDSCTFNVNTNSTNIGPLSLKVEKPKIIKKTADSSDNQSAIGAIIEKILNQSKGEDFKILKEYGYVPDIEAECKAPAKDEKGNTICKSNDLGQPEIEIKYKANDKSRMLCLSGWKPEPEEFVLEREDKVMSLKKIGANYAKYNTVYSKESNQFYYFPRNETVDLLAKPQSQLNEMIFNKHGYVSIPEENNGRKNCIVKETSQVDAKQDWNECKIVYELKDAEYKAECKQDGKQCNQSNERCNQCDEGCMRFNNVCERSTQYVNKDNNQHFYLKISQEQDDTVKILEVPTKANSTEVFYADRLCRFDLEGLKKRLHEIIMKQLQAKKDHWENTKTYGPSNRDKYTGNLSQYDHVEIEAWGGGEPGHIIGKAYSTKDRSGMPGDYIKAKLKIDPNYPIIRVKVTEGGGNREDIESDKNGGATVIEMCDLKKQNCRPLITVAGGGADKEPWEEKETVLHREDLKLEGKIVKAENFKPTEDNKIPYIKDGKIEYETVSKCSNSRRTIHGAGGCINKSNEIYSKGSPGYAIIKPILKAINPKTVDDAINRIVNNPNIITSDGSLIKELSDDSPIKELIGDSLISKLDPKIIETIKEEIRKELLG
ncbi:hypothetical protein [Wolbachia endosymbiont (group E) of Neria commutata]|uniref:hypothetical protein n=1 Tax=Wolbachia endosymbiont (group E) of Neria commutata TaxID=3066149 RepID=UPI003132F1C3